MTPGNLGATREELIDGLISAAPPGQAELDPETMARLLGLSIEFDQHLGKSAVETFNRFLRTAFRELQPLSVDEKEVLGGQSIAVTGGAGCIGRMLLRELATLEPARLISIDCEEVPPHERITGVEYVLADVRCGPALDRIFANTRPTFVFHLAAQRDPELAEQQVCRTISTNILGTQRLLDAAARHGASTFVYASTGKGHRFYTSDIYAATKQVGEWATARARSESGMATAIVRFTHVVDNSLIHRKVTAWAAEGKPIRLHDSHARFYLQSARECARLLTAAAIEARRSKTFVSAIRDLGEPADLLDFALGACRSVQSIAPIYICGFERGYESESHPAVHDPSVSGDFSPLLNGMEALAAEPSIICPELDRAPFEIIETEAQQRLLDALEVSCFENDEEGLYCRLGSLSWELLLGRLKTYPVAARNRALGRGTKAAGGLELSRDHQLTTKALVESLRMPFPLEAASHF